MSAREISMSVHNDWSSKTCVSLLMRGCFRPSVLNRPHIRTYSFNRNYFLLLNKWGRHFRLDLARPMKVRVLEVLKTSYDPGIWFWVWGEGARIFSINLTLSVGACSSNGRTHWYALKGPLLYLYCMIQVSRYVVNTLLSCWALGYVQLDRWNLTLSSH